MQHYMTPQTPLPPFMAFPRFLLRCGVNETAKILYVLLLDRARVSMKNGDWQDERGRVFLFYPVHALARDMGKSERTVKSALSALERAGLIARSRTGSQRVSSIYVLTTAEGAESRPENARFSAPDRGSIPHRAGEESSTSQVQIAARDTCEKPPPNINKENRNQENKTKEKKTGRGTFQNVMLSEEQLEELKARVPNCGEYVERLSSYMASTGKKYADHAAAILSWALRDRPAKTAAARQYDCEEGESL